jgi:hypothetical protein
MQLGMEVVVERYLEAVPGATRATVSLPWVSDPGAASTGEFGVAGVLIIHPYPITAGA